MRKTLIRHHQNVDRMVIKHNTAMNRLLLLKFVLALSMTHALASKPPQTPEQIQQQKNLAAQQVIEDVAPDFRTPLAVFEKFYAGLVAGDVSELSLMTQKAIEERLGPGELTPEELQRIRDGEAERDEKKPYIGDIYLRGKSAAT